MKFEGEKSVSIKRPSVNKNRLLLIFEIWQLMGFLKEFSLYAVDKVVSEYFLNDVRIIKVLFIS